MLLFSLGWLGWELLVSVAAALRKRGARSCIRCPLSTKRSMNLAANVLKSSHEFCSQYLRSSPEIRPFRQLGGCADLGGM